MSLSTDGAVLKHDAVATGLGVPRDLLTSGDYVVDWLELRFYAECGEAVGYGAAYELVGLQYVGGHLGIRLGGDETVGYLAVVVVVDCASACYAANDVDAVFLAGGEVDFLFYALEVSYAYG